MRQPVGEITALLDDASRKGEGYLIKVFPPDAQAALMGLQEWPPMQPFVKFGSSQLAGVLTQVRNEVLMWSLRLEEQGILGERLSFTGDEVRRAAANTQALAPTVTMHNCSVQLASPGAVQSTSVRGRTP